VSECNKCLDQCHCPEPATAAEAPAVWAIVSLMGHKQYAGKLSEVERFGGKLGRIDVIDADGFRTVEFNAGSVYSIEYVSEEAARIAARRHMPKPVESWELPKQLAPASAKDEPTTIWDGMDADDDDSDVEDL
jgi:hypothetical protein